MGKSQRAKTQFLFVITLVLAIICLDLSIIKTNNYNNTVHSVILEGPELFSAEGATNGSITVSAVPRNSTWGKIIDLNNEGIEDNNYQAFTYDITVSNNTRDEINDFTFKLIFGNDVFLASAWNGALEIHQYADGKNNQAYVPDMREFSVYSYSLDTIIIDGEKFLPLKRGDWLMYYPSSSMNAMEVPIEPHEGTTPGFILYVANGENIDNSVLIVEYSFHRLLRNELLFWVSLSIMALWMIVFLTALYTSIKLKKFKERHERDNKIINESIETFTGFIDAKDPYTNGHSKRVATYTRLIARKMGYEGEELDRIYYIALLHDCGKIGVPDNILGKPGRLTDEEFEIIKSHTVRGGEILSSFKSLKNAGEGALYHHERYDGKGYPEGKAGNDIPLIARMICVADSFDAMNTNRVYRKKLTREQIIAELEKGKGSQFDPQIADIMLNLINDGKIFMDN